MSPVPAAEPRKDACPICGKRMTTERGYRCFACTQELSQAGKKKRVTDDGNDRLEEGQP